MHLSDGTLRRSIDEPHALDAVRRRHLGACPRCRRRAEVLRAHSQRVTAVLSAELIPPPDTGAALRRVHVRLSAPDRKPAVRPRWLHDPRRRARVTRWSTAAVGALAVSAALVGAGVAQGFITIFQPTQVVPIAVTGADIASLQELASYGDVSGVPALTLTPVTRAEAQSLTGVTPPGPTNLPRGSPPPPPMTCSTGGR